MTCCSGRRTTDTTVGHHTFPVDLTVPTLTVPTLTVPTRAVWGTPGQVAHNLTRVIAGIATTALRPTTAADETVKILRRMVERT
jgi:replication-associated recombination protein RarA